MVFECYSNETERQPILKFTQVQYITMKRVAILPTKYNTSAYDKTAKRSVTISSTRSSYKFMKCRLYQRNFIGRKKIGSHECAV